MGETEREYPLDFTPHCHQFEWMRKHLGGWQFGEEMLIPVILDAMDAKGCCIEYGAGNGDSLPLTLHHMYARWPSNCTLVEIDQDSRDKLKKLYPQGNVVASLRWPVGNIAVVVIDIDGMDSVVMRDMLDSGCRPALIVCEHMDRHYSIGTTSPSLIPDWLLGTKLATGHAIQDTAETLHWIACEYGYDRIGFNRCNSFFVRRDLFPLLFR